MEAYESHVTTKVSPVWGPKSYPPGTLVWGPYQPPSLPPSASTRWFNPYEQSMRVVPSPKPSSSWEAVKRSGEIRMTSYEAERITTFNTLAGRAGYAVDFRKAMDANVKVYPATCAGIEFFELEREWREQGDFAYWSLIYEPKILNTHADVDLRPYIASTQTSAIAAFRGGYDFLTELAEARQGLEFFKETSASAYGLFSKFLSEHGSSVKQAIKAKPKLTARDLLRSADRNFRKAGSAWLAYRYALMPLFYSYQDIRDLIEAAGISYQTYRDSDIIEISPASLNNLQNGLYEITSGSISVRSTIKAAYSNAFLRDYVSNQVQWNPFATAWELVPLSFVMDWFVNVGDYIVGSTSTDFSLNAAGCTAIKTHVTVEAVLRYAETRNIQFLHAKHSFPTAQTSCQPTDVTRTKLFNTDSLETCRSRVIEHYVRKPFDLDSASIALNPSLNWKRAVDAVALSHDPLKKLIMRFKK